MQQENNIEGKNPNVTPLKLHLAVFFLKNRQHIQEGSDLESVQGQRKALTDIALTSRSSTERKKALQYRALLTIQ